MTSLTQAPATTPSGVAVVGSTAHSDGGFVPVQTRSERPRSYDPADFGVPTGREVDFTHTPVARLAPLFVDADASANPVEMTVSGAQDVFQGTLAIGQSPRGDVFEPEDVIAAVAWTRTTSALHLRIPASIELAEPVEIDVTAPGAVAHSHIVIEASAHSRATVLLRHRGEALLAQNVEIIVRDGAHLTVVTVQEWSDGAVHAASHQARVDRDAYLRHIVVSLGGAVVRLNPSIELAGSGAEAEIYGLSFADAGQHLESQVYLHHKGPQTRGNVLYKSALQGDGARTVWVGDVLIGPDATGTDSYEANRNLVLTEGARADSIPNLEIETGDIRGAGHASATGRFDDEQLFYLQARGIPEEEARRLVVRGFLAEIVQKLGIPALEEELSAAIEAELTPAEAA
ncbi:Fe-S cluster assembly protein SufD [Microbacterium rhizomatis]|uniref:Fe-S cluster assembly protein SufD n=1 Tax=Microbacterium rhizomatis TaxID=1631477 RepID=A0A5J5J448_9MICO|nr:Fe-S cluster assembly protein SufD [Microbacterium rhizomatis]KAA9110846.1 Fe-S cluster assembly protein SufD [Microbacterium rhizomatis]